MKLSSKSRGIASRSMSIRLKLFSQEHGEVARAKSLIQNQITKAQRSAVMSYTSSHFLGRCILAKLGEFQESTHGKLTTEYLATSMNHSRNSSDQFSGRSAAFSD